MSTPSRRLFASSAHMPGKTRWQQARQFVMQLSCIAALSLSASTVSAQAAGTGKTLLEQAANKLVQQGFQGAILAARGDTILFQQSYGRFGDLQRSFRYASITKQMTAIILMQEVEAGRLQLDERLGKYWPDFPNKDARAVSLRQLGTHYSGLYNENAIADFHMAVAKRGDNMQAFASTVCADKMNAKPGARFDYNNCDYLVLGALLERTTKKSFAQLLAERIFKPAGMTQSGLYNAAKPDDAQHLHGILDGQPEPAVNFASYGAAGSAYGNLRDLYAFQRSFMQGKYLSAAYRSQMLKPNQVGGALGVWSYPFKAAGQNKALQIVERQGWIAGVRLACLMDMEQQHLLLIISANSDFDMNQTWANKGPAADLLTALINQD